MNHAVRSRRYLTFSLRSLFVVTTALAVWLGIVVNRAREQREAVKAIEAVGGYVVYDWEWNTPVPEEPPGPAWLRRLTGDDFFQNVKSAGFHRAKEVTILKAIPQLRHFRSLEVINIPYSESLPDKVRSALPNCDVILSS